jgi:hypothetical protein
MYNRIRQSKIKFYAELNGPAESEVCENPINKSSVTFIESEKRMDNLQLINNCKTKLKRTIEDSINSYHKMKESEFIRGAANKLDQGRKGVMEKWTNINRSIQKKTEKTTQGLYEVSSRLFEDKYEFTSKEGFNNLQLATITGAVTVEWDLAYNEKPGLLRNIFYFFDPEKISEWFSKMRWNIVLFFVIDEGINDIDEPQNIVNPTIESKTIFWTEVKESFRNSSDILLDNERRRSATKKLKSKIVRMAKWCRNQYLHPIPQRPSISSFLKKILKPVFPTINRFI